LEQVLEKVLARARVLYHAPGRSPVLDAAVKKVRTRLRRRRRGPKDDRDPRPLIHAMRLRKDPSELSVMRRAAAISARAHVKAMAAARPGMHEYQLEAVIEGSFRAEGATGWAYPTIVGSGPNACILHHIENDRRMRAGDLVLVDAGCEVDGYAADITRTFPVSGRFRKGQRELYDLVLAAQKAALAEVRPGNTLDTPHHAAVAVLAQGLIDLKFLPGPASEVIESGSYRRFYMHRTSHWLGLDVHDVGGREDAGGRPKRLGAGMVLTVEPGLYMRPDEEGVPARFRGQGIRIEDDVLVTAGGCEILTGGVPKTAAAVERACRR
jgi:Xaa-Pro aminopeptidase